MTNEERDSLLVELRTKVSDMHACLFGNGQPGVQTRLTRLEESHACCPARKAAQEGPARSSAAAQWVAVIDRKSVV